MQEQQQQPQMESQEGYEEEEMVRSAFCLGRYWICNRWFEFILDWAVVWQFSLGFLGGGGGAGGIGDDGRRGGDRIGDCAVIPMVD